MIAIIGILSAMAFLVTTNVLPSIRADSAMQMVTAQLRQAREASIDQRRNYTVTFKGTAEIVTLKVNLDLSTAPVNDFFLPGGMTFTVFATVPDTPDGFGKLKAVGFNCGATLPCTITFQSDGSVLDSSGALINGSVFMGVSTQSVSARAVTIIGSTGRIRGYRYIGTAWN